MENYYTVLDVPSRASQAEIKERFRFLANAYHPDKFATQSHKDKAEDEFKKINEAYQILSVPAKRAEYDRRLSLTSSASPAQSRNNSPHTPPGATQNKTDIYAIGQSFVRTVIFAVLFYLALNLVLRFGVGGLLVMLILGGLIYSKFFWK